MFGRLIFKSAPVVLAAACCVLPLFGAEQKEQSVSLFTRDGWSLSAVYRPSGSGAKTVILLHDSGKNKEAFSSFQSALAREDFGYLAVDLRGYGQSTGKGAAASFSREGVDNEFNKMTRDAEAAVGFLRKKGVAPEDTVLLGAGLGANVAAKSVSFVDVPFLALISPTTNTRDVLSIPSMRLYKGNVLIAAGAADKKTFLEASVIRNVAFLSAGEGKVTFLTAYDLTSHAMLDKYLIPLVLQWLKTPQKPETLPDEPAVSLDAVADGQGNFVPPSDTEDSLVPSVLF